MKKFFEIRSRKQITPDISRISESEIAEYRKSLLAELKKMGADENDINLVSDTIIINAINKNRKAEDVAWAILQ